MENNYKIEGRNPVMEALKADKQIDKIYILKGERHGSVNKITGLARDKKIPIVEIDRKKLDEMSETKAHQGVIAYVSPVTYVGIADILARAEEKGEQPFIILLDGIEDPHNLGSVLRTANAAGAHGVVITKHRSAHINAAAVKTAAGACFYTPVAMVTNLVSAMKDLKKAGVWFYGADMDGENDIFNTDFSGAVGIVIGSEGKGLSRVVKDECDFIVSIPMKGEINSLNASVSAGIMMYKVTEKRCK